MVQNFEYTGVLVVEPTLPNSLQAIWKSSILAERARILASLLSQVPNSNAFTTKVADASSDAWEAFVDPTYPNYEQIVVKQRVKLGASYAAWNAGIVAAFAPGGTFDLNVDAKEDKFQKVNRTIAAVGMKAYGGWMPVSKAAMLLNGETLCERYMGVNDTLVGHATIGIHADVGVYSKPTLIAIAVQGFTIADLAQTAGLTAERAAILIDINARLASYLDKVKKAGTVPEMSIDWNAGPSNFSCHAELNTT